MKMKSFVVLGAVAATSVATPAFADTAQGQFSDVQPTNWAYQAILQLKETYGCAKGFPNGTFNPGQSATRADLAALTNACLNEIQSYVDSKDASLAQALRAEFNPEIAALRVQQDQTAAKVQAIEVATATKAQGVGNYLGAAVLLNNQGVPGGGKDTNSTISGATIQGRYEVASLGRDAISVRPYVNFVAGPNSQFGAAAGALATYDWSIARTQVAPGKTVSAANIYLGGGAQVPLVNGTQANAQSAVGQSGQAIFVTGIEGRLTDNITGFADLKWPTQNAGAVNGGSYSPVAVAGLAWKF
jgi:S-layer homology domain